MDRVAGSFFHVLFSSTVSCVGVNPSETDDDEKGWRGKKRISLCFVFIQNELKVKLCQTLSRSGVSPILNCSYFPATAASFLYKSLFLHWFHKLTVAGVTSPRGRENERKWLGEQEASREEIQRRFQRKSDSDPDSVTVTSLSFQTGNNNQCDLSSNFLYSKLLFMKYIKFFIRHELPENQTYSRNFTRQKVLEKVQSNFRRRVGCHLRKFREMSGCLVS